MGEVYLAEHLLMKRPCAIKIIRPEKTGNRRVLARFEREVRATAKLSHWNTIDIFDYGRAADGTFYYVMEYLPGLSLAQMVDSYGPLAPERVIFLLSQTCDALSEAHAAGLIHRDIKPANIFVARRGGHYDVAKLLDFGMVKPMGGIESVDLSIEGSITGSPLFMSPEQALGTREPDVRSDIYSLGVVGYFLLSGRPPFESQRPIQVLFSHANQKPVPLSIVAREVPKDLESVIMRCMEKQPEDRYQSAAELAPLCRLASHLEHGLSSRPPIGGATWIVRRKRVFPGNMSRRRARQINPCGNVTRQEQLELGVVAIGCASRVCRNGLFLGRRIHGDLDVRAIGIPWAFFHVFP